MKLSETQVSIVVPCRNEAGHIEKCLRSILAQEIDSGPLEVIVADGMSIDGTREILAKLSEEDSRLQIVDNPKQIVSTGLNAAIRMARGAIIVRMDAHTQYAPDYVSQCVVVLGETAADNVGGPWVAMGNSYMSRVIAAAFQSGFCSGGARAHDADYEGVVDSVYLGCWPRAVFDRIGLFDETLTRNQDDELNLRLTRAEGKIWQSPKIVSWYFPRASISRLFQQYFQYGFWKVAVIKKHRIPASWRHVVPGVFVLTEIVLLLAIVVGSWTGSRPLGLWSFLAWLVLTGAYVLATLGAAIVTANKRTWSLLPALPAVFAVFHLSYGLGFLTGLACLPFENQFGIRRKRLFSEITR